MFRDAGSRMSVRDALTFPLIWSFRLFTSTFSREMVAGMEQAEWRLILLSRYICYLLSSVGMLSPSCLGYHTSANMLRSLMFLSGSTTSLFSGLSWAVSVSPLSPISLAARPSLTSATSLIHQPLARLSKCWSAFGADLRSILMAIHPKCGRTGLRF